MTATAWTFSLIGITAWIASAIVLLRHWRKIRGGVEVVLAVGVIIAALQFVGGIVTNDQAPYTGTGSAADSLVAAVVVTAMILLGFRGSLRAAALAVITFVVFAVVMGITHINPVASWLIGVLLTGAAYWLWRSRRVAN
jgi:hypothetical protein